MYIFKTFGLRALLRRRKSQIKSSTYTRTRDTRRILYIMQRKGSRKCVVRLNKDADLPAWPAIHMLKRHSGSVCQTMTNPGVSADPIGDRDRDWSADHDSIFFQLTLIGRTCQEQWAAFIRSWIPEVETRGLLGHGAASPKQTRRLSSVSAL